MATPNDLARVLPFYNLTNYQFQEDSESHKRYINNIMEQNGFKDFIDNIYMYETGTNACKNVDIDEYNNIDKTGCLCIYHMNIKMLANNRGYLVAFLSTLHEDLDVIILTEIGINGHRFHLLS